MIERKVIRIIHKLSEPQLQIQLKIFLAACWSAICSRLEWLDRGRRSDRWC